MLATDGVGLQSMVYKLADMILLRITQTKENGPLKAHGDFQWAPPWGKTLVDMLRKARIRHTGDGALFAYLECIGDLDICAGVHQNGKRFFMLCDSSRGQVDLPDHVDSVVELITQLSPIVVASFHRKGDDPWVKYNRRSDDA